MSTATKTRPTASRAAIRKALVAAGIPIARSKTDAAGVHLVTFVYVTGIAAGATDHTQPDKIRAALDAAGIEHDTANMVVVRKPVRPESTDLGCEDPTLARQLIADGWIPTEARLVKPGQTVIYWDTDVFQMGSVGEHHTATVHRVTPVPEEGGVKIEHGAGITEADECTEVWTR